MPPLKLDAVQPIDAHRREVVATRRTSFSSLIGLSMTTVYLFTFSFALSLNFLPIEVTNPNIIGVFLLLGIGSLIILLAWICVCFRRHPTLATFSLRLIAVSIPFYLWMATPRITA